MALQTNEGLCLGREVHDVEERAGIALDLLLVVELDVIADTGNGEASRAMTRFAVYQWEAVIRLYLLPMDTVPEIVGDLVMRMALGDTVVGPHILRVQPADDHLFVLPDRQYRSAQLQVGAGTEEQE